MHGRSRGGALGRVAVPAAPAAPSRLVRAAFATATGGAVLLNLGVVILSPLWQDCQTQELKVPEEAEGDGRRLSNDDFLAKAGRGKVVEAWSCMKDLEPGSIRLVPDAAQEAAARAAPRWLFFGLSSVHRKQAEYLGITLSHLFEALNEGKADTGIVVHLADFDEHWVSSTQHWLKSGFEDEVTANRLHVIHAPERLYPEQEQVFKNLKYGDPPFRQWWRAKQNLDYAFLMWYAAGLSEFYMQLEDDVQVVPRFLPAVRDFMQQRVSGNSWVMVAFSKLGFIGKLFQSSRLPKLAEFLLVFHDEAPCDWLVWVFIDAISNDPVTAQIPEDLESELGKKQAAKTNPSVKLPKSMRNDVLLYYRDTKNAEIFLSKPAVAVTKPPSPRLPGDTNGPVQTPHITLPPAQVFTNMIPWKSYTPNLAYGGSGFWTSNTCCASRPPACSAPEKFIEVVFDNSLDLCDVKLVMGAPGHVQDYLRNGTMEVGYELAPVSAPVDETGHCASYAPLIAVQTPDVAWSGSLFKPVRCLRIRMLSSQEEWVMLRFTEIKMKGTTVDPTQQPPNQQQPNQQPQQHHLQQQQQQQQPNQQPPQPQQQQQQLMHQNQDQNQLMLHQQQVPAGQQEKQSTTQQQASQQVQQQVQQQVYWQTSTPIPRHQEARDPQEQPKQHLDRGQQAPTLAEGHSEPALIARTPGGQAHTRLKDEEEQATLMALLASSVGLLAGMAGWASVFACWHICPEGVQLVGELPCWASSFLPLLDMLLSMALKPPALPHTACFAEGHLHVRRLLWRLEDLTKDESFLAGKLLWQYLPWRVEAAGSEARLGTLEARTVDSAHPRRLAASAMNWAALQTPARQVDTMRFQVLGPASRRKNWLAAGLRLSTSEESSQENAVQVVKQLLSAGDSTLAVVVHLSDESAEQRSSLAKKLQAELARDVENGRLHIVRAPEHFYAPGEVASAARPSLELAVLMLAAAPIADFYIQVEPDVAAKSGFVKSLRDYVNPRIAEPWHVVSLTKLGLHRKLLRSEHLPRFAELLVMFPEVPPDALLWDFVDIINNQTAPKSCYIAFSATKMKRTDVILQYHKAEALIEHVGDVSSLSGKVQRIHDDYFKKHSLTSSLFDNPDADVFSASSASNTALLRATYGASGNNAGQNAPAFTTNEVMVQSAVGKAVVELVFKKPISVQIFNMRMGGYLRAGVKGKKAEIADPDFEYVLENAVMEFGHSFSRPKGSMPQTVPAGGFCQQYEAVANISGREVFWRCPASRPARGVDCIKVTLRSIQKNPLIVRSISVRSFHSSSDVGSAPARKLASGHSGPARHLAKGSEFLQWQERQRAWTLAICFAFGSGSLAGVLGYVVVNLQSSLGRRSAGGRKSRSKVAQA